MNQKAAESMLWRLAGMRPWLRWMAAFTPLKAAAGVARVAFDTEIGLFGVCRRQTPHPLPQGERGLLLRGRARAAEVSVSSGAGSYFRAMRTWASCGEARPSAPAPPSAAARSAVIVA